jgi:hypothetical protein
MHKVVRILIIWLNVLFLVAALSAMIPIFDKIVGIHGLL